MLIRCGVTGLISKHILLTRFNEAARDYFSITPLVVCGRLCGEAIEGAVLNSNVVSEAVNDVIQEDSSLSRVCAILELAILDSQIVGLSFFVAFAVNLNTITVNGIELAGKTVAVSGSGNVAIYATEKAQELGAKVVTVSDSTGWVYDPEGIDVAALKEIKEVKRARLTEYKNYRPNSEYHEGRGVWNVKVDIALPCATQNELHLEDAKALVANGCIAVCEGANMPTTLEATQYLQENGVIFAPGKAANAGGVATSALEMSQNSERLSWTFEEVDAKLKNIMVNICHNMADAAERYGFKGNYVVGANIAGFEKVVDAMTAQGIC